MKTLNLLFVGLMTVFLAGCPEIGDAEREMNTPTPSNNANNTVANNTTVDPMNMDMGTNPGSDMGTIPGMDMATPDEDMGEDMAPDLGPAATTWLEVAPMLTMKCGECHAARFGGTPDQIRTAIEGVNASNGIPLVTPNNLAQSEIYLRVTSGDPATRMPRNAAQVDQVLAAALDSWISNGAIF